MKFTRILVLGLLVSLLAQITFLRQHDRAKTQANAVWAFIPQTLAEARQKSSAIIVGNVVEVRQAPDRLMPVRGEPEGVAPIPNQQITLDVRKSLKGKVGSQIVVEHYGNALQWIADDPPYIVGETYVLFVEPKSGEPNVYYIISPPGRYRVVNDTLELMPEVTVPFATALRGKPVAALEQALAQTP